MSERKWLIRKKGPVTEIMGPMPREELRTLITGNKLNDEDEMCSANGFWFELSESEMVEKYVWGNEIQHFNPVSDAQNVLAKIEDENSDKDSPHPQGKEINDITLVEMGMKNYCEGKAGQSAKSSTEESGDGAVLPSSSDLEYPKEQDKIPQVPDSGTPPKEQRFWKKLFPKKS